MGCFVDKKTLLTLSVFMNLSTKDTQKAFDAIRNHVCKKLEGLSDHLTYHNIDHTLDVLQQSERIARDEGLEDEHKLYLLKVAAMYHDTGFLVTYADHEKASCDIFRNEAALFDFTPAEQAFIVRLIMATRLPQQPADIYECVICDADLDYLGRSDFFRIGDGLRKEFLHYGIVRSDEEWDRLQMKFLSNHSYHTNSCRESREYEKQAHMAQLR
ncbi:MAG: HD domain-containing protein [Chitinophagaceae bacterium]|nr:MAG: HD domain-containing protein [Chitinophagaceae bacterium]